VTDAEHASVKRNYVFGASVKTSGVCIIHPRRIRQYISRMN